MKILSGYLSIEWGDGNRVRFSLTRCRDLQICYICPKWLFKRSVNLTLPFASHAMLSMPQGLELIGSAFVARHVIGNQNYLAITSSAVSSQHRPGFLHFSKVLPSSCTHILQAIKAHLMKSKGRYVLLPLLIVWKYPFGLPQFHRSPLTSYTSC